MNAFMVWAKVNRKIMASQYPSFSNLEISKLLGKAWNEMNPDQRRPFINEAKQLRIEHLNLYPEFRYQTRRRQRKSSKKSKPAKKEPLVKPKYPTILNDLEYTNVPTYSYNYMDANRFDSRNCYEYQPVMFNCNGDNYSFVNHIIDKPINYRSIIEQIDASLPSIGSLIINPNPYYSFSYPCDQTGESFTYLDDCCICDLY